MNTLQSLHGHLSGFHFLIFLRKIGSVAQSLMLEGTKFQFLGPRYDNVSVPYNTVLLIASAKSRSARGASHQPAFMSGCLTISHTCLPCPPGKGSLLC